MSYEFSIATLQDGVGGLETLEELGVPWPEDDPSPYSVEMQMGDGGVRGLGWPTVRWHWNFLTIDQWNTLREYCPEKSSDVIIRTFDVDNNQEFVNYQAKMIWPTARTPFIAGNIVTDVTIIFQALILIPEE